MRCFKWRGNCWTLLLLLLCGYVHASKVTNLKAVQRWPWNGKVDITYSIEAENASEDGGYVLFSGHDNDRN